MWILPGSWLLGEGVTEIRDGREGCLETGRGEGGRACQGSLPGLGKMHPSLPPRPTQSRLLGQGEIAVVTGGGARARTKCPRNPGTILIMA